MDDDELTDVLEYMASQGWNGAKLRPRLRCQRCGDRNVYWQRVPGKDLLYNTETLEPHVCQTTPEGFDDVE